MMPDASRSSADSQAIAKDIARELVEAQSHVIQKVQAVKGDKLLVIVGLVVQFVALAGTMIVFFMKMDSRVSILEVQRAADTRVLEEIRADFKSMAQQVIKSQQRLEDLKDVRQKELDNQK